MRAFGTDDDVAVVECRTEVGVILPLIVNSTETVVVVVVLEVVVSTDTVLVVVVGIA